MRGRDRKGPGWQAYIEDEPGVRGREVMHKVTECHKLLSPDKFSNGGEKMNDFEDRNLEMI